MFHKKDYPTTQKSESAVSTFLRKELREQLLSQLVEFARWLQSPDGQAFLQEIAALF